MQLITEEVNGNFTRNTLPRKIERNSRGIVIYRSDYELRGLRKIKTLTNAAMRDFGEAKTIMERVAVGRFYLELLERERILLRIPLPASQKVPDPKTRGKLEPQRGLVVEESVTNVTQTPGQTAESPAKPQ